MHFICHQLKAHLVPSSVLLCFNYLEPVRLKIKNKKFSTFIHHLNDIRKMDEKSKRMNFWVIVVFEIGMNFDYLLYFHCLAILRHLRKKKLGPEVVGS
jgi:hypothetical protein